jgi:hypothetical protein
LRQLCFSLCGSPRCLCFLAGDGRFGTTSPSRTRASVLDAELAPAAGPPFSLLRARPCCRCRSARGRPTHTATLQAPSPSVACGWFPS